MTRPRNGSSASAELPTQTAWSVAHDLHRGNFVTVVKQDIPIYLRLFRRFLGRSEEPMTGYHVNIAEMQRMRLRALQYSLVQTAVDLHVGDSLSQAEVSGHGDDMKLLLVEYSEFFFLWPAHELENQGLTIGNSPGCSRLRVHVQSFTAALRLLCSIERALPRQACSGPSQEVEGLRCRTVYRPIGSWFVTKDSLGNHAGTHRGNQKCVG